MALAVLATIVTMILGEIQASRRYYQKLLEQETALQTAQMALQTGQSQLEVNGVAIQVKQTPDSLTIYQGKKEILHVEK